MNLKDLKNTQELQTFLEGLQSVAFSVPGNKTARYTFIQSTVMVWMLDNGMRSGVTPKLVAWDTRTNKLHRLIKFPPSVVPKNAFVNDLAVDKQHNHIFISDPAGGSNAALIVVNLQTGKARRVLEGHKSVIPEKVDLIIDKQPLRVKDSVGKLIRPHIGVNPIAEDLNNEWGFLGQCMAGVSIGFVPRTLQTRSWKQKN